MYSFYLVAMLFYKQKRNAQVLKLSENQLKKLEGGEKLNAECFTRAFDDSAPTVDKKYDAPQELKRTLKSMVGDYEGEDVECVQARSPEKEDSCPICCDDLLDGLELVHCKYGCGKAVHAECFQRYERAQEGRYRKGDVPENYLRCVYCRTAWRATSAGIVGKRGMLSQGHAIIDLAEELPDHFEIEAAPRRKGRGSSSASASSSSRKKKGSSSASASASANGSGKSKRKADNVETEDGGPTKRRKSASAQQVRVTRGSNAKSTRRSARIAENSRV